LQSRARLVAPQRVEIGLIAEQRPEQIAHDRDLLVRQPDDDGAARLAARCPDYFEAPPPQLERQPVIDQKARLDFPCRNDIADAAGEPAEEPARPALIVRGQSIVMPAVLRIETMRDDSGTRTRVNLQPTILVRVALCQDDVSERRLGCPFE